MSTSIRARIIQRALGRAARPLVSRARRSVSIREQLTEPPTKDYPPTKLGRLEEAIDTRQQVRFWYRNEPNSRGREVAGIRFGNPHAVYKKDGAVWLDMWTLPRSTSESRNLPAWRTYKLSKISRVDVVRSVTGREWRIAPGYRPRSYRQPIYLVSSTT
jgi:hypothetical protein